MLVLVLGGWGWQGIALAIAADLQWGGHLKHQAHFSFPDTDPVFQTGSGPFLDNISQARLKAVVYGENAWDLEVHHELSAQFKDKGAPGASGLPGTPLEPPSDDRRAFNLTGVLKSDDNRLVVHRLDRLALTLSRDWGALRVGRQALTWGNGLVFNPMDLFNPFSPTDLSREYKTGDDMAWLQVNTGDAGEAQVLAVARRDEEDGDLSADASSFAGRYRFSVGSLELSAMAARHYEDYVAGAGFTFPVGDALFRTDATWTRLDDDAHDGYLSWVANLDYSWVWVGRNFYGLMEVYYSGLGRTDYTHAVSDPLVLARLERGEIFTLGPWYLAGRLEMEAHPLLTLSVNLIANPADPSAVVQPRAVWSAGQDLQVILGADLYTGGENTEFGGFFSDAMGMEIQPADVVYVWITWYF